MSVSNERRRSPRVRVAVAVAALVLLLCVAVDRFQETDQHSSGSVAGHRHFEPRWSHDPIWHRCPPPTAGLVLVRCGPPPRSVPKPDSRGASLTRGALSDSSLSLGVAAGDAVSLQRLVVRLERERRTGASPAVENDLAVAYLLRAQAEGDPSLLVRALGAIERAKDFDSGQPTIAFNRALILTYLHLGGAAGEAWQHYLELDRSSPWAGEALAHLRRIRRLRETAESSSRPEDDHQLERHRLESVLDEWSTSADPEEALQTIEQSMPRARALAQATGDGLLVDAYQLILDSRAGPAGVRRDLQEGHRLLAEANRSMRDGIFAATESSLRRASELLARAASPYSRWADLGLLRCAYQRGDFASAEQIGREILADSDPLSAVAARTWWVLGSARFGGGELGSAEAAYQRSATVFSRLGEHANLAAVRHMLAGLLEWVGKGEEAWQARHDVLAALSDGSDPGRVRLLLIDAAFSANAMNEPEAALAFQDLAVELAEREPEPLALANALLRRAELAEQAGGSVDVIEQDLARSDQLISQISDADRFLALRAQHRLQEARRDLAKKQPETAIAKIEEVLEHRSNGTAPLLMPELLVELARGQELAGLPDAAEASRRRALSELERQRRTTTDVFQRVALADRADGLHEALIEVLLDRADHMRALEAAIAGRSSVLRDRMGVLGPGSMSIVNPGRDEAILTYSVHRERLAIWVRTEAGLHFAPRDLTRADLSRMVAGGRHAVQTTSPESESMLRDLHRELIAPVADTLRGVTRLTIQPDEVLFGVPFAALIAADGRYLVEDFEISIGFPGSLPNRHDDIASQAPRRLLAIFDPAFDPTLHPDLHRLPGTRREAIAIAREYPEAVLLGGEEATEAAVIAAMGSAEVVHLGAHGRSGGRDPLLSSLVLAPGPSGGDTGRLTPRRLLAVELKNRPLVVLAACESVGTSHLSRAEGPIGLAWAFLVQGAQAVMATLWEIDDEGNEELLRAVHVQIRSGSSAESALRSAQLEMIEHQVPPALWSAWLSMRSVR